MIFIGSDIVVGGNIIMPIAINTADTARSMIRKGSRSRKLISNARRSSDIMKAGTRVVNGTSAADFGAAFEPAGKLAYKADISYQNRDNFRNWAQSRRTAGGQIAAVANL
jgi:hypothetical protein